jgi:uncharacterized protein YndB with AHSA1/START domain
VPSRSVTHMSFTIERRYAAPPARVFAAFADAQAKERWFVGPPGWRTLEHTMDFRVGGREVNRVGPSEGPEHRFDAVYLDIVPDERIVFAYGMHMGETRLSASLTTIELRPDAAGTHLAFTEQGAFLDGHEDPAMREQGTRQLLESLAAAVEGTRG